MPRPLLLLPTATALVTAPLVAGAQPRLATLDGHDAGILGCQGNQLERYAYERSDAGDRTSMWWRIPDYRVDLTFTTKRSGYETSGGNGTMRIFSGAPGDSISIPVRVDESC
jgi:hypothetical protein